ncbi:endo-beta-N-acetylglucosaminidase [Microbacterium murale]|uniref:Endo-beta-N-acetylglucosaminidase D n=1 Tax=Microbacterium murale TaxID=1081040 RepID=A0ABU0P8W5_9MICO|nr:hypothetical protein [Microbacterium murale]MDQ0643789.1 endo-beta-N-acetylglucosaminidase D [Microbacterium murale]
MTANTPPNRARRIRRGALAVTAASVTLTLVATGAQAADTLPWEGDSAIGENQPYQHGYTATDVLDWSPATDQHASMLRAHVPLQERNAPNATTQRNPELPAETQMLTLAGDYGNAFFESHQGTNEFSQYLFNYWQYTDVYAPWHGMASAGVPPELYDPSLEWTQRWFEFGMLNLPNPAYTNAAHANGALSIACIFFSANDRGDQNYRELLVRDEDGGFPVADKLVEMAKYFGYDGYFINQEEIAGVAAVDVPVYKEFLQVLRDGGMYVQWYDSTDDPTGDLNYQNEFNEVNSPWVLDPEKGRVTDSMFLNYWWNADMLSDSRDHALSLGLDPYEAVYAGVEAGGDQFEQEYDLDQILDENGDPKTSIATLGADFVSSDYANKTDDAMQWEVFDRERRWWTGSSSGSTEPEEGWDGISKYIAERSVVDGSTFSTDFNTGHGLANWTEGQLTSEAEWGDINRQDVPPTWQWWVESESATPLTADFDYGPEYVAAERFAYEPVGGYTGGSSLVLSGALDAEATVRLFQTDLDVTDDSNVELTFTKPRTDDSELRVSAIFASAPDEVVQLPVSNSGDATEGWRTEQVSLGDHAGDRIITLGLSVAAGAEPITDYQVNVGALRVLDGEKRATAEPTGLTLDEYLPSSSEAFVSWDLAPYDEVRRYELFLDDQFLVGGYDETMYVKNMPANSGTLRLVAIAPDGTRSEAATARFDPDHAVTGVTATQAGDQLDVSWTAADKGRSAATVTVLSPEGDELASADVKKKDSTVSFPGLPQDGSEYRIKVETKGNNVAATLRGNFADTQIEPYPADAVRFEGDQMFITRPTQSDWHTLTILEDGVPVQFDTTYSQGPRPYIIRGRTTLVAMSPVLASDSSRVTAVLEDYAGNTVETVLREGGAPTE